MRVVVGEGGIVSVNTTYALSSENILPARKLFSAAVAALLFLGGTASGVAARPWRLADIVSPSFPWISDVRISPDGTRVLARISFADIQANTFTTSYRLVDIASGVWLPMPAHALHPRWSPDGSAIGWIVQGGSSRIMLTDAEGKHVRMLTTGARSILAFSWSPNGSTIAAIEVAPPATTVRARLHWFGASNDFLGRTPPRRELWKIDVATWQETELTRDGWSYGGVGNDNDPSFSADGASVAVVRQPSAVFEDFDHEQYVTVAIAGGATHPIVGHPFFAYPHSAPPVLSPVGSDIAYVATWDGKLASREDLFVGASDVTAQLDRDLWSCAAGGFEWQPGMLVVDLLDGVSERLYRVDLSSAVPRALTPLNGSVEAFSVACTGRIAYVWTTPEQPPDIYVLDPGARRAGSRISAIYRAICRSPEHASFPGPVATGTRSMGN